MHRAANKIDFFTGLSSKLGFADFEIPVSAENLFQYILTNRLSDLCNSRALFTQLANQLIQFAEHAYCLRNWDSIEETSVILMRLPLAGAKEVGGYYQAIAINRRGRKEEALTQFETILDKAPFVYRARAAQALGMIHCEQGQLDESLRFSFEALRMASSHQGQNLLTSLMAGLEIAVSKSITGDHRGALEDFEKLFPLVRFVSKQYPFYFYLHHNALAVEFSELGRITEAENAISVALASPFISAYPEWSETREEIEQKRNYPDPSRCFLDRSITESEANTSLSATIERQAEAASSPQSQREVETKPLRAIAFHRFIKSITCQRPLTLPNAALLFIPGGVAKSFLQRLGRSVQLRGPPAYSLF